MNPSVFDGSITSAAGTVRHELPLNNRVLLYSSNYHYLCGITVKQIRIVKKAMGWFAIVSIFKEVEIPRVLPHGHFIGVDIGLLNYLATSDGFVEPGRKFFKSEHRRLKVLQRRLPLESKAF